MAGPEELLPALFVDRLRKIVGEEAFDRTLASFRGTKCTAFRVNTLKAEVAEVTAGLRDAGIPATAIPWLDVAFIVPPELRHALTQLEAVADGRIYIQNLSSMMVSLVLDPHPGESVLDLCAAPGGKTLHLATMMQNQGQLAAVEAIKQRRYKLRDNIRRHGASMVKTYLADGRTIGGKTVERFDRVLLDAPCSAEARFRAGEAKTWAYWSERKIREQARKQKGLLKSAARAAKVGGTIVYGTCSFAPEENELAVEYVLDLFPDCLELLPLELPVSNVQPGLTSWAGRILRPELALARRILPDQVMDAIFLCKLRKTRSTVR
jgi:16S rRNA (cytosine1407-C5)-methyltransferase